MNNARLLYLVTEDWFFCSHFLPMARAARRLGLEVVVATRCTEHAQAIRQEGFSVVPLPWQRSDGGLIRSLRTMVRLFRLLRADPPDIVHCIALKPSVLGGVVARLAGTPHIICAITGLGRTGIDSGLPGSIQRWVVRSCLRWVARDRRVRLLVENRDHERSFVDAGYVSPERMTRVPGAGVDLERYRPRRQSPGAATPVVALVARMIPFKGVAVAVSAMKLLADRGVAARLWLIGAPDPYHRGTVRARELEEWAQHPAIEWLGRRDDVPALLAEADIALLPSLGGEGLPKSLVEAAACGMPIVTTDTDGCREIVSEGANGFLVPPGDVPALADALETLLRDPRLRADMGRESRRLAEERFGEEAVTAIMSELYATLMRERSGLQPSVVTEMS